MALLKDKKRNKRSKDKRAGLKKRPSLKNVKEGGFTFRERLSNPFIETSKETQIQRTPVLKAYDSRPEIQG